MEEMDLDPSLWRGRKVLLTGHTGFKGAWLALWLEHLGAEVTGLALPAGSCRGAWSALSRGSRVESHEVDLRDAEAVAAVARRAGAEVVFHLAAQAIVRSGFDDPIGTYVTNVIGTLHLLDALRSTGGGAATVIVTSDKVYENAGIGRAFVETDRLGGADPYSSSKACTEMAVAAWRSAFPEVMGGRVATARAGNVLGGGDRGRDRLGPDVERALATRTPLRVRHPESIRPWQFVLDALRGYILLAQHLLRAAEPTVHAMNFGPAGEDAVPVRWVVERLFSLWGSGTWEPDLGPAVPEASTLRLDASLARSVLGWAPAVDLEMTLEWTTAWWRADAEGRDLRALALSQIEACEALLES